MVVQSNLADNSRRTVRVAALAALGGGFSGGATASSDSPSVVTCTQYPMTDNVGPSDEWLPSYLLRARAGDEVIITITDENGPYEYEGTWVVKKAVWNGNSNTPPAWNASQIVDQGSFTGDQNAPVTVTIRFDSDANIGLRVEYVSRVFDAQGQRVPGRAASGRFVFNGSAPCNTGVASVPTLSEAGLLATGGLMVLAAGLLRRRRNGKQ